MENYVKKQFTLVCNMSIYCAHLSELYVTTVTTPKQCTDHSFRIKRLLLSALNLDNLLISTKQTIS